jgi:type I restriction enzyme, S subunit
VSFHSYPVYKPSGVEWLGEVPEHWEVKPLKRVAEIQTGLAKGKEVELDGSVEVPFLRVANVQDGFLDLENVHMITIQESSLSRYLLNPGDVLMNEGGDFDKLGRGCIWDGVISPCIHQNHIFAVRPHSIRPSWLNVYTSSKQANSYFISRSKQSTNLASISSSNLMDLLVPIAPDSEAEEILGFLDRETAKIDALIAEQQRLIELLQEKRQAVISHAVTKGLNPNATMKDSGVEWLGEVPEHWETGKIKHYFRTTSGSTPNSDKPELYYTTEEDEQGTPWIRTTDIDNDKVNAAVVFITPKALEDTACKALPVNTVLVALYGGGGTVGKNGILKIEAAVNQALCGILPSPKALPEYVHKYIQFLRPFWMERAVSARKAGNISQELVGDTTFPIPPLQEQTAILRAIEEKLKEPDELANQSTESLVLLEERRSALISAAVTGQIDVRGLVEAEAGEQ